MIPQEQEALENYIKARKLLKSKAKRQFTENTCPLNLHSESVEPVEDSHYGLSQSLWGIGGWCWDCEFCGKYFSE